VQAINRALIEKAMAMRCVSFYADAKARLLTATVFGMSYAKRTVQTLAEEMEARVRERTQELEVLNARLRLQQDIAKQAAQKAADSNRAKSSFLANMSHEIRTPLTAILGFGHLIETTTTDETVKGFATRIVNNGHRLLETINGVLDVARIESGKGVVHLVSVDLSVEARRTLELVESLATQKNLELECGSLTPHVWVTGDLDMIRKVLTNIVGNAIKFTRSGKVSVTSGYTEKDGKTCGCVTVADTGVGIAPEFMPRLFEEFRQESLGTAREFEGSGIGLALSRNLLNAMNGDIKVSSIKGIGTKVEITLPSSKPLPFDSPKPRSHATAETPDQDQPLMSAEAAPAIVPPQAGAIKVGRKVLLVDDNPSLLELFKLFIGPHCDLTTTTTGAEALRLANSRSFDIVLMDINLGAGADGIETMLTLRQTSGYATIPIIALTAYALKGDKERFLGLGFDGFLPKPISQADLQAAIKSEWRRTPGINIDVKDQTP